MANQIDVNGTSIAIDDDGYLEDFSLWSKDIATAMAKQENTELSDEHWEIISFLRDYYATYQIAPAIRVLTKRVGKQLGKEKGNYKYLYRLFPYGPGKQACRYAGLPKPTGCI